MGCALTDWLHACLQGASKLNMNPPAPMVPEGSAPRQVVYLPSCVTRMMGPAASDTERASVHDKLLSLFSKAGYEVIYPEVRTPAPCCRRGCRTSCLVCGVLYCQATPLHINTICRAARAVPETPEVLGMPAKSMKPPCTAQMWSAAACLCSRTSKGCCACACFTYH